MVVEASMSDQAFFRIVDSDRNQGQLELWFLDDLGGNARLLAVSDMRVKPVDFRWAARCLARFHGRDLIDATDEAVRHRV